MAFKRLANDLLPPCLLRQIQRFRGRHYGFSGSYSSWEEASRQCRGYDAEAIFAKVGEAALAVRDGHCAYERDSVQFTEPDCHWPILASLMAVAAWSGQQLRVLDFGGSLGSLYLQHQAWLQRLPDCRWGIVEQPHFVTFGQRELATDTLSFHASIEACVAAVQPNVILLASVLQYLPDPYAMLDELLSLKIPYIVHDRTTCAVDGQERCTVQRVHPSIYPASYPAWLFAEDRLDQVLLADHHLLTMLSPQPVVPAWQGVRYVGGLYARLPQGERPVPNLSHSVRKP